MGRGTDYRYAATLERLLGTTQISLICLEMFSFIEMTTNAKFMRCEERNAGNLGGSKNDACPSRARLYNSHAYGGWSEYGCVFGLGSPPAKGHDIRENRSMSTGR